MGVGVPHSMQVGRLHGSAIFISVFEFYSRRTDVEKKEEARGAWGHNQARRPTVLRGNGLVGSQESHVCACTHTHTRTHSHTHTHTHAHTHTLSDSE